MLTFFIVVVVVVAALAALVLTRPASFRVERRTRIAAPPAAVYGLIQDFRNWRAWSPWEDIDPELKRDYMGAESGVGAAYVWEGDNRAGTGRMEIVEAAAPSKVKIDLRVLKPFPAHNTTEFLITPVEGGADVTWAMYGPNSLMGKAMSLFMSMDKMVGSSFETGLARMKAAAEG
jgi:hypothetical protein